MISDIRGTIKKIRSYEELLEIYGRIDVLSLTTSITRKLFRALIKYDGIVDCKNKFKTVRNVANTRGWILTGLNNLSQIDAYTDNAGVEFVPLTSVNITITVLEAEDFVTPIVGARVGIHRQSDNSEIVNDTTNASGVVSASFPYTVDVDVFIKVRQETEDYPKIPATITASGLTQTIAVSDDDIYTPT